MNYVKIHDSFSDSWSLSQEDPTDQVLGNISSQLTVEYDGILGINESSWSSDECHKYAVIVYKDEQHYRSKCNTPQEFTEAMHSLNCTDQDVLTLVKILCQCDSKGINCSNSTGKTEKTMVTMATAQFITSINISQEIQTILNDSAQTSQCRNFLMNELQNSTDVWCFSYSTGSNCSDIGSTPAVNCSKLQTSCSEIELQDVYNEICRPMTKTSQQFAALTTTPMRILNRVIVNDTLREKIFDFIGHNISGSCRWIVGARIPRPLTDLRRVCKMFTQSGGILVANHICTTDEVIKLTAIFCRLDFKAGLRQVASTEEGRRTQAMDIMANELTAKCHDLMWPQVVIFTGSLSVGCKLLQQAAETLVLSGFCTQTDIDKLEPVVCYVQPIDQDILRFQAKLNQVLNEMGESCNATLHSNMVNATSATEACLLWSNTKTSLLKENICSDHDETLFTTTLCSGQELVSLSLLSLLLSFIFATVLQR
ncbi:hypothetical protein Btru_037962 [Bulinus truncatus]|nr:hypothetical protein Btru_037962 [Bulinus truncatus]